MRTCCSYAINTADLDSYVLQSLVGAHCYSTFAPAARRRPLLLAIFVCAARLPSTSSTCVDTRCRISLVSTAVLHSYSLLVYHLHRRSAFACRASLVPTAVLHLYTLLVCHQNRQPAFLRIRTSLVRTTALHSYMLLVCRQHRRPAFVRVAESRWYPLLSFIHTRHSSAVYIVDLLSHALQNLIGTHCCPSFVLAARLPSTSSTCFRTRCRASLLPTAVLPSYSLLVYYQHR